MMCRTVLLLIILFLLTITFHHPAFGKTIVLEGKLNSSMRIIQHINFSVERNLSTLSFRFPMPAEFSNKAINQTIQGLDIKYSPQPAQIEDETDSYGNRYRNVVWNSLTRDARITMTFESAINTDLSPMESRTPFPLPSASQAEKVYLAPTNFVQSNNAEIMSLAKNLTGKVSNEYEAVTSIVNFVVDHVKYAYNPPEYDALYTLHSKSGNCTNLAHLSLALLRASGIPARFVAGISLNKQWKIPIDDFQSLVQAMGQGKHAWIEIYFPDLGWLSYDPAQTKLFTSTRHIKETHGLDYRNIVGSWSGSPYAPKYSSSIEANFIDDMINIKPKYLEDVPKSYLYSSRLIAGAETAAPEPTKPYLPKPPEPRPPEPKPPEPKPKPLPSVVIEFGNMEFPSLVNAYKITGNTGIETLDAETAEYVTSTNIYAQAFKTDRPFRVETISLAVHAFGGDGTVYIDLISDNNGKPGLKGIRSFPLFLDKIKKKQGYYWVDFKFPQDDVNAYLKNGKYWILLRRSGEAIITWFYTPGKSYGDPEDTRSTIKGYRWEDILNYDFVFKVRGESQ
jgi:transglutaminase-like putative cysteine protease